MKSHWRTCGFRAAKDVESAREDAIIVAVHEDNKHAWKDSCPECLADTRLGQTKSLQKACTRV